MSIMASSLQQASDATASERVLAAIAAREDADPLDFDRPLYDVIDPDALDALFRSDEMDAQITFAYLGYEVAVRSDGTVELDHIDG